MAANIPPKIKAADLTRFIVRAAQLEKAKPVISYWCEYWAINQILSKGLHNGDNETFEYTTKLMDKLEQLKSENATNDAIIDDTAGQAYVEQFALETFQRADRTVQADKVTKQTADTFQASATFFELVNIWSPPDPETQSKIKYAKWNALRIMKAIKEGKDPNESNPKTAPASEETLPALDPNDPEVQSLEDKTQPRQASVEDVPDEQDKLDARLARQSSIDQSLHPSAQVSARGSPRVHPTFDPYPRDGFPYTAVQDDNVSPLEPSPNPRNGSVGGGYFPEVPTFTAETQHPTLPTAPPDHVLHLGLPDHPSNAPGSGVPPGIINPDFDSFSPPAPNQPPPDSSPQEFYRQDSPPPEVKPSPPSQPIHSAPTPQKPSHYQPFQDPTPQYQPPPPQQYLPAPPPAPIPARGQGYNIDDVSITKAQKHAKWAISALNFEDAETAVKELRLALETLGAQ